MYSACVHVVDGGVRGLSSSSSGEAGPESEPKVMHGRRPIETNLSFSLSLSRSDKERNVYVKNKRNNRARRAEREMGVERRGPAPRSNCCHNSIPPFPRPSRARPSILGAGCTCEIYLSPRCALLLTFVFYRVALFLPLLPSPLVAGVLRFSSRHIIFSLSSIIKKPCLREPRLALFSLVCSSPPLAALYVPLYSAARRMRRAPIDP